MTSYNPPLVVTVHGIRTHGKWQVRVSDSLNKIGIKSRAYDYGYYKTHHFLRKSKNRAMVDQFYEVYRQIILEYGEHVDIGDVSKRPSVIAHSFGSFIVGHAMLKYEDIVFDKVLVCGCILPRDFAWSTLIARDQVNLVRNEYGVRDFWAKIVKFFVSGTGDSGYRGFHHVSSLVEAKRFEYFTHSDFFGQKHLESHWLPFLRRRPSGLGVLHGRAIESDELFARMRNGSRRIDERHYGKLSHYQEVEIPYELPFDWIAVNPDIYTFLLDRRDGECKGYINAMPVTEERFKLIQAGKSRDNQIKGSDVLPFATDQEVRIYLMSIGIDSAIQRVGNGLFSEGLEKLVNGFCDKLLFYAIERDIRVTEVTAVAWTDAGNHLCKLMGMSKVNDDEYGNPIYWVDLRCAQLTQKRIFPALARLLEEYRKRYPR